ncbi:cytochrome c oxidase assembly factor 6 homolog [Mizuhopecten yessoensis]|uniref:cytochrome c oxidase assembly factor 6 homolog n=1 Tax=Mizuhopecten yessoensis TaxID=6573 RepID=UPI000B45B0E1|nr:cytochrome c oxidase assembly factor 6 homolog [Mizuhopecten yessoensis]
MGETDGLIRDGKQSRKECYSSRDAYWKCLDRTPESLAESKCKTFSQEYEKSCHPSWVIHFNIKRSNEVAIRKYALLDPVDQLPPVGQSPDVEAEKKKTFIPFY